MIRFKKIIFKNIEFGKVYFIFGFFKGKFFLNFCVYVMLFLVILDILIKIMYIVFFNL